MIYLTLMRMRKNKWLMLALLLGMIIAVTTVCMVPVYSHALTQRMLITQLKSEQAEGSHPGAYTFSLPFATLVKEDFAKGYQSISDSVDTMLTDKLPMKNVQYTTKLTSRTLNCTCDQLKSISGIKMRVCSYSGWESAKLLYGALPSSQINNGTVEAVITKNAEITNDLTVGQTYFCSPENDPDNGLYVTITGVIDPQPDGYASIWDENMLDKSFLCDFSCAKALLLQNGLVESCSWRLVFDYSALQVNQVSTVLSVNREFSKWLKFNSATVTIPQDSSFEAFLTKESTVSTLMTLFEFPMLLMVAFYLVMVSSMVVETDKNELALLLSRGATRQKILGGYLFQSGLLAGLAFLLSPFLAMVLTKLFGRVSGFLSFSGNQGLSAVFSWQMFLYGFFAALFTMLTMLLPCLPLLKTNVVQVRRKKHTKPLWKRTYLDLFLLAAAFYGYYSYRQRQTGLLNTGAEASSVPIDPLIFLILFLFAVGAGLLFLRLYAPLLKLLLRLVGNRLQPSSYAGLLQAAQGERRQHSLELFVILTLILSIFCANSARSMNENIMDRFYYSTGADVVATLDWNTSALEDGSVTTKDETSKPFLFRTMDGVAKSAKIIKGFQPSVNFQGNSSPIRLMGIDTKEFADLAWMREDLNKTHINEYLNLLGSEPMACLISKTMADALKLKKGDAVTLHPTTSNPKTITLIVYEVVEYWPTYNGFTDPPLLVANADYLDYMLPNLDYDAWLSPQPGTSTAALRQEIGAHYSINSMTVRADLLDSVNYEASRQATNGILTLDFLAVGAVCLCGFLLFWILSMKNRLFQLATLQAMGMTEKETFHMLLLEQAFISVVPILIAVCLAWIASELFVPVISVAFSAAMQVPPLRIAYRNADYGKLYAFVLLMLGLTLGFLLPVVHRLKPAQAIKLSEE